MRVWIVKINYLYFGLFIVTVIMWNILLIVIVIRLFFAMNTDDCAGFVIVIMISNSMRLPVSISGSQLVHV